MINHVTYQLSEEALGWTCLEEIMVDLLGFVEVQPNDPFEHGWQVRWFKPDLKDPTSPEIALGGDGLVKPPLIHFVAARDDQVDTSAFRVSRTAVGLGHFCVVVSPERFEACRRSDYLARDSGSGRIWLEYDNNRLRIEVRSS